MTSTVDPLAGLERRRVTIMFGDLQGYTAATEASDPEVVAEVIGGCLQLVRDEVERHSGLLARTMGDGFLAIFGAPVAREDDAKRAIECALAIQSVVGDLQLRMERRLGRTLPLRIGINTGPTVLSRELTQGGEMPLTGDAVNVAARLESLAKPGTTLVGESTRELARDDFQWSAPKTFVVRNRLAPVVAYELLGPAAEQGYGPRVVSEFFGRAAELGQLAALWGASRLGGSETVLIEGPPGCGKSRLLHEFLARLDQSESPPVAFASSSPRPSAALDPLRRMVVGCLAGRSPADAIASPAAAEAVAALLATGEQAPRAPSRKGLRDGLVDFFREWLDGRRGLMVLEDAQWTDPSSLRMLFEIQHQLEEEHLLCVYLARPSKRHLPRPLRRKAAALALGPLSPDDARSLVTTLLGSGSGEFDDALVEQVLATSEGIPLFVEEIGRMLRSGAASETPPDQPASTQPASTRPSTLPGTVEQIFLARLDEVEPRSRQLAQEAAVIGRAFPDELLAAVTDAPAGTSRLLLRLENADFLRYRESVVGDGHEFTSYLTWNTIYESLLIRRREELHLRIAEAIEQMYPDALSLFLEPLASHYELGGRPELAAHYYLRASRRSQSVSSSGEARSQRRRAARLVGLTSLWAATLRRERASLGLRLVSVASQCVVAGLLVLPIMVLLMTQRPPDSDRIIGFPTDAFEPSLASIAVLLLVAGGPIFLAATAVTNFRGPAYVESRPALISTVFSAAQTVVLLSAGFAAVLLVLLVAARRGMLGASLEVFVWSTAWQLIDGRGTGMIAGLVAALCLMAVMLEVWMVRRAGRWRTYLSQRPKLNVTPGEESDRRTFANLSSVVGWAAATNLLLFALYSGGLLPPGFERPDLNMGSTLAFAATIALLLVMSGGLWAYSKRVSGGRQLARSALELIAASRRLPVGSRAHGRRPRGLGLEVPLVLAAAFGVIIALTVRNNVLMSQRDVFEPAELDSTEAMVSLMPESPYSYSLRGGAYTREGRERAEEAQRDFERALAIDPHYHSAIGGQALARLAQGDFDAAEESATEFIDAEPDHPTPYLLRARVRLLSGQVLSGLDDLITASELELEGVAWDAYLSRCEARLVRRWFEQALEDCLTAADINPYALGPGGNRGAILGAYRALGREDDASESLEARGVPREDIALMRSTITSTDLAEPYSVEQVRHIPNGPLYESQEHHPRAEKHGVADGYASHLIRDHSDGRRDLVISIISLYTSEAGADAGFTFHTDPASYDEWRSHHWPADAETRSMTSTLVRRDELQLADRAQLFVYELSGPDSSTSTHEIIVLQTGTIVALYLRTGNEADEIEAVAQVGHGKLLRLTG